VGFALVLLKTTLQFRPAEIRAYSSAGTVLEIVLELILESVEIRGHHT
jgi:hypothetical protein